MQPPPEQPPHSQNQGAQTSTSSSPGLEEKLKRIRQTSPELLKKPEFTAQQKDVQTRLKEAFQKSTSSLKWLREASSHFPVSRKSLGLRDFTLTDQLFFMQLSKDEEISLLPVFFQPGLMVVREGVYQYLRAKYGQDLGHNPVQWETFIREQP